MTELFRGHKEHPPFAVFDDLALKCRRFSAAVRKPEFRTQPAAGDKADVEPIARRVFDSRGVDHRPRRSHLSADNVDLGVFKISEVARQIRGIHHKGVEKIHRQEPEHKMPEGAARQVNAVVFLYIRRGFAGDGEIIRKHRLARKIARSRRSYGYLPAVVKRAYRAAVGAAAVLIVITAVGRRIKDIMVILILGMMFSSGVGAVVQILQYFSHEESLKAFVIWTMGSLGDVTLPQLTLLGPSVAVGLLLAVLTIKPLNLLLFGEEYAVTMGLDIRRSRGLLFLSTTLLAGTITAFCGPIGFIGLAIPHVTRMLFQNSDHRVLLPGTTLSGASILLLCDVISKIFTLPINAITALLGIPIVVWVVLRNKSITV